MCGASSHFAGSPLREKSTAERKEALFNADMYHVLQVCFYSTLTKAVRIAICRCDCILVTLLRLLSLFVNCLILIVVWLVLFSLLSISMTVVTASITTLLDFWYSYY